MVLLPVALGVADAQCLDLIEIVLDRRDEDSAESGIVAPRGVRGERRQNAPGTCIRRDGPMTIPFLISAKWIGSASPFFSNALVFAIACSLALTARSSFEAKLR